MLLYSVDMFVSKIVKEESNAIHTSYQRYLVENLIMPHYLNLHISEICAY